ncbi:MAG: M48 family metalloprotease [Deltaproteobacteria bacterium]|nr:M48 family metalloprotease [Deltaproteobacteria bacterium]
MVTKFIATATLGLTILGHLPLNAQNSGAQKPGAQNSPPRPAPAGPGSTAAADLDLFRKTMEAAFQAAEHYGSYEDPEQQERILRIGYELASSSRFDEFPFSFYLIDMPIPNAFALPGGQIFITRGMLDLGLDDDMLACLLGHELAHVIHHHGTRMQKRATLVGLLSQALVIGVLASAEKNRERRDPRDIYGYTRDPHEGGAVQGAAAVSLVLGQLLLLSHSREFEDEADDEGQRLAAAAGYDPQGAQRLWSTMLERIPQQKAYGYWRTHPFEDSRMRAAKERSKYLKIQPRVDSSEERQQTQLRLLDFASHRKTEEEISTWVKASALSVWPQGPLAEGLRKEYLHSLREAESAKSALARDYGEVITAYEEHLATVATLTPDSPFLIETGKEVDEMQKQAREIYPMAVEVLEGGIFETAFLETFLSNFPDSPELAAASLALGNAYSRRRQPTEAVEQFLRVWQKAPASPEAKKARAGLRNLADFLEELSALQRLASMDQDPELQRLAQKRLEETAATYKELDNGADYLRRFPNGDQAAAVTERLNSLAHKLYTEILVYQGVGDHAKALERMNQILTHAPLSPAADELRLHTTLDS